MSEHKTHTPLDSLRWKEDTVITNYGGERVWLRAVFVQEKQIGITDYCLESEPCDYHGSLGGMIFQVKGKQ